MDSFHLVSKRPAVKERLSFLLLMGRLDVNVAISFNLDTLIKLKVVCISAAIV